MGSEERLVRKRVSATGSQSIEERVVRKQVSASGSSRCRESMQAAVRRASMKHAVEAASRDRAADPRASRGTDSVSFKFRPQRRLSGSDEDSDEDDPAPIMARKPNSGKEAWSRAANAVGQR